MERLIFEYTVSDDCTYWETEYIPFVYESKSAAEWNIMAKAFQTFLNDDLDEFKGPHGDIPEPYSMKIFNTTLDYHYFFSRYPILNSERFKIDYTPKFEIHTLDEFFTGIDPLFS